MPSRLDSSSGSAPRAYPGGCGADWLLGECDCTVRRFFRSVQRHPIRRLGLHLATGDRTPWEGSADVDDGAYRGLRETSVGLVVAAHGSDNRMPRSARAELSSVARRLNGLSRQVDLTTLSSSAPERHPQRTRTGPGSWFNPTDSSRWTGPARRSSSISSRGVGGRQISVRNAAADKFRRRWLAVITALRWTPRGKIVCAQPIRGLLDGSTSAWHRWSR